MARTAALTALSREPVTLPTLGGEVLRLPYPGVIADRFFYLVTRPHGAPHPLLHSESRPCKHGTRTTAVGELNEDKFARPFGRVP
jgi:hypothetical protein